MVMALNYMSKVTPVSLSLSAHNHEASDSSSAAEAVLEIFELS